MSWLVVIPDRVEHPDVEARIFGSKAEVVAFNVKENAKIPARIEEADAILAWHDLLWDRAMLSRLKKCKALVRVGVGFDNVDLAAAKEKGIVVCNVPDYGTDDVADHAMALLLTLARGLVGDFEKVKQGASGWYWGGVPAFRLKGKKLGVVGLGRIGSAAALRARAFGLDVAFYDPYKPAGWDKVMGIRRFRDLGELAAWCDVVSLHTPLTSETKGMIGGEFFERAKKGLVLINTARGPVVEWAAFKKAFESEKVALAGFDVLPTEPIDESDDLLSSWKKGDAELQRRLLITPHCAFYCPEALEEMRTKAAEEALRILEGKPAWNRVDL